MIISLQNVRITGLLSSSVKGNAMRKVFSTIQYFFRNGDSMLLFLCLAASGFGLIMIASASQWQNDGGRILVQLVAIFLGIILFVLFSLLDISVIAERREVLFVFNLILIGLLFTPLAEEVSGNKSWLNLPIIPFNLQPAEICKITFIMIIAKTMDAYRNSLSKFTTVLRLGFHLCFVVGLLMVASGDAGSALMYILIFVVMLWTGGVHWSYFLGGAGLVAIFAPIAWNLKIGEWKLVEDYQRNRILMIFDNTIDPYGSGIRWHTKNSLLTLANGGITGQGLFNGLRTQTGALSQQHTDFIFSVVGEELGIIGCMLVLLILFLIIFHCFKVGNKSGSYMNRQICIGIGSMLIWQVIINVGMCTGLTPVIGLTLPFFSYGGSSIVSTFAAMGIIAGIYMHPNSDSELRYIRPPF